jgi:hypothetical protein
MRKLLTGLFIFTLAILTVTAVRADESDMRLVFEERYAAMKSAMANRDGEAMASLLAPGFISTEVSGQTKNASQIIQEVKALPIDPLKVSKTTVHSIKMDGSTASVKQSYDMKTRKVAADGTMQNIELIGVSEDTWVLSNGVWLCQSTTTIQLDYFVNGQAVIHKVRTGKPAE